MRSSFWAGLLAPWKLPSAEVLAQRELEQARRDLLECQTRSEYCVAMVQVNRQRITRLTATITEFHRTANYEQKP